MGVTEANASIVKSTFLSKAVGELMGTISRSSFPLIPSSPHPLLSIDYSSRDHFVAVLEEDDLLKVINLLSKEGTHRVAVIDILQDIRHILTQTDIVRYPSLYRYSSYSKFALHRILNFNIESLANVANITIKDLGLAYSPVVSVLANDIFAK